MTANLTAHEIVRRIARDCMIIDHQGQAGILIEPAAALVKLYGDQFRPAPKRQRKAKPELGL